MEQQTDCFGGWTAMPEQQAQKKVFKGVGKVIKKVAPIAAPIVGTAIGGPMGGRIGGLIGGKAGGSGSPIRVPGPHGTPVFPQPAGKGGGFPGLGGGMGGFANSGIGGILGHNLGQADARREFARYQGMKTDDWKDRMRFHGDESMRQWDAMLPRRAREFDQNLGFQNRMFGQWLPQRNQVFWQDWEHTNQRRDQDRVHRNKDFWQDMEFSRHQDDQSWGNWDKGIGKLGDMSRALGL